MFDYQRNDIVKLTDTKFDELKENLWFSDNTFVIKEVNDNMVLLKELDRPVSLSDVLPMSISRKHAEHIYYDPVIAASLTRPDDEIPAYISDLSYFMDHFERVLTADGSTLRTQVEKHKYKYVHELQHWLREQFGTDDLMVQHKIITMGEMMFRNIWNLRGSLLEAGVSSYQFLYEMANMLYLRWMAFFDEKGTAIWNELEQTTGDELLNQYQRAIQEINQSTRIYSASVLEKAICEVAKCVKKENIAELFDLMLQENSKTKTGGAINNSTPQVLTQIIVDVLQPKTGEYWHDPAAGYSGFLVEIDKYLRKNNSNYQGLTDVERAFQITEALSGMEIQKEIARIGFCNTRFHGLRCKVLNGDSLSYKDNKQYDGIICEPPMPLSLLTERSKINRQTAFVELILDQLKIQPGSRAAILLPESFLTKSSAEYSNARRRLFGNIDVHTILRLPKGIYPNNSLSMCVLFIKRSFVNESKVLVYDMQKQILKPEQLQRIATYKDFIKTYRSRLLDNRSQFYSLDELRKDAFAINFGVEDNNKKLNIETPSFYLVEANKIVKDIRGLLSQMEKEING